MNVSDLDIKLELKYYPIREKLFSQEKYWDNLVKLSTQVKSS